MVDSIPGVVNQSLNDASVELLDIEDRTKAEDTDDDGVNNESEEDDSMAIVLIASGGSFILLMITILACKQ